MTKTSRGPGALRLGEERLTKVSLAVPPSMIERLDALRELWGQRSRSAVARELLEVGLRERDT